MHDHLAVHLATQVLAERRERLIGELGAARLAQRRRRASTRRVLDALRRSGRRVAPDPQAPGSYGADRRRGRRPQASADAPSAWST